MTIKRRITDAKIAAALKRNAGKVTLAAKSLHCSHAIIYRRMNNNPKLKAIQDFEVESLVDLAESKLKEAVGKGESWAICFALKCQGKKRGYIEKQAIEHSGSIEQNNNEVIVKIEGDWYGTESRIPAEMFAAPGDGASLPCPTENSRVRAAMGKNGNGSNGNGNGSRPKS